MLNICDVFWEGPFAWEQVECDLPCRENQVLYSIHGTHGVYGTNTLLYIGMTEEGVGMRLIQHKKWIEVLRDPVTVKVASIGRFATVADWQKEYTKRVNHPKQRYYATRSRDEIKDVEALLIYAHQPAYNSAGLNNPKINPTLRIFNTGHFGRLHPELSWDYYHPRLELCNR